jgi:hypothetical protein
MRAVDVSEILGLNATKESDDNANAEDPATERQPPAAAGGTLAQPSLPATDKISAYKGQWLHAAACSHPCTSALLGMRPLETSFSLMTSPGVDSKS